MFFGKPSMLANDYVGFAFSLQRIRAVNSTGTGVSLGTCECSGVGVLEARVLRSQHQEGIVSLG